MDKSSKEEMYIKFKIALNKLNIPPVEYEKIIRAFCEVIGY